MSEKIARSVLCGALLALTAGCYGSEQNSYSSPSEPIPEMTIRIDGLVVSEATGRPIPNAEVQVVTQAGSSALCIPIRQDIGVALGRLPISLGMIVAWGPACPFSSPALTDEFGRFTLTQDVRETTPRDACLNGYVLMVSAPGYQSATMAPPDIQCTETRQAVAFTLVEGESPLEEEGSGGDDTGNDTGDAIGDSTKDVANGHDSEPVSIDPPALLSPLPGAQIPQNVGLAQCPSGGPYGSGHRLSFDWSDTGDPTTRYRLYVRGRNASVPLVDALVYGSSWSASSCGFVADHNLDGWYWRVRVESPDATSDWSEERTFDFLPCRLDDGTRCNASPPPVAAPGEAPAD